MQEFYKKNYAIPSEMNTTFLTLLTISLLFEIPRKLYQNLKLKRLQAIKRSLTP